MVAVYDRPHADQSPVRAWSLGEGVAPVAWVPHVYVLPWDVVWFWNCVPPVEQRASSAVADAQGLLLPGALGDVVDLFFQLDSPLWWEKRLAAWRGNWSVQEEVIEVDEVEIRIYRTDALWWLFLFDCQLGGGCGYGGSPCPARPSYTVP